MGKLRGLKVYWVLHRRRTIPIQNLIVIQLELDTEHEYGLVLMIVLLESELMCVKLTAVT